MCSGGNHQPCRVIRQPGGFAELMCAGLPLMGIKGDRFQPRPVSGVSKISRVVIKIFLKEFVPT
jgi:hypothetical protein